MTCLVLVKPGRPARVVNDTNPYRRPERDQGKDGLLGPFSEVRAIEIAAAITVAANLDERDHDAD